MHRWWMDFGGAFEVIFWRVRRFILLVCAKDSPKNGPNDTRKAPPTLCTPRSLPGLPLTSAAHRLLTTKNDPEGTMPRSLHPNAVHDSGRCGCRCR